MEVWKTGSMEVLIRKPVNRHPSTVNQKEQTEKDPPVYRLVRAGL